MRQQDADWHKGPAPGATVWRSPSGGVPGAVRPVPAKAATVRPTGSGLRQVANTQGSEEFPDWGPHPLATSHS
jgi:hypothetical protein